MHLTDHVIPLDRPAGAVICLAAAGLTVVGLALGARRLDPREIPRLGLLTAWVFVASSISIPLGGLSVHLGLYGLAGFLLRGRIMLCVFTALLLQLVLLQHGGVSTLGVNTLILSFGGFAGWALAAAPVGSLPLRAGLAGALGIFLPALLLVGLLRAVGYPALVGSLLAAYGGLALVEACLTAMIVQGLSRIHPGALDLAPPPNSTTECAP
ncbi:MAG TPA: energy-coupling factor ABC transporter permease [Candidatus Sumerlaeota bacterium]|nr:energy-coupling factor ABC transporter permease [Candidatus Sumerlaeota bacterium]HOR28731.1 energy-coupling factor ABC transporter permease [Candidatus Sumerlaeota bacterium]HPK02293.1 energy-coupling factor ABC transporter permease [Candidatus Sumerlaeota bacterium]